MTSFALCSSLRAKIRGMSALAYLARLLKFLRDPWPARSEEPARLPDEPARIVEAPRQQEPPR